MNTQDQISRLIEPTDQPEVDDGISPKMPFPTAYQLNRDQEEELVGHAMQRLLDLESEMGRDVCAGGDWWNGADFQAGDAEGLDSPTQTWMGKRHLYDKTYKNEMDWRPRLLGGVFEQSNLVVPAARRICRQMIARAVGYFFGTTPWFAIYPTGACDRVRADKADRYLRWKMDQAKLQRTEEQAIERAFILGEGVIKTGWAQREQIYKTKATVLVDDLGKDILGADGDYILEDDLWVSDSATDPITGDVVTSGLMILKRDGQTPQPEALIWQEKYITRRITHYKGPEAKVVNFIDFLCPLEAETIQEADCIVHLYDKPLMELANQWKESIATNSDAESRVEATRKAMELIRALSGGNGQNESGQNSSSVDRSSKNGASDAKAQPVVKVAEFHLRYDIDGSGLRELILIVDRSTRLPIFYDYEANITPDGLRPFSCLRVNEVPGRWYGLGAMEMFNPSQQIVDLWMNRKNSAASRASRVDFWKPHYTLEGRANTNLDLNWGGTYTPIGDKTGKDCLESIYLTDNIGDTLQSMIEFVLQFMTNESGVSNANDAGAAGLDSNKLATGIRNIEKSGQELFSLFLGHLEPGVSETLNKMVKVTLSKLDDMEVYRYFEEGEECGEGGEELRSINPGDIANIELDTRILLTRFRGEQILESSLRAWETVEKYFDPLKGPEFQERVAPMAIDILKALQVQNAKDIIRPLTMPMPGSSPVGMPPAQQTAQAAAGRPRQASENL